ncbi:MAG: tRNA (adenosine(37)-N6)-threonylcarbamoyltransferase complex ATPase subunit type 1 TsaE, partial [Chloroflexi bacterium]|nr:tRNA (adenosine(37)-N6)-threonylcarbamoyltransferase complex ATPase subunit type 1 TsaE [Chloroflexota bacterium]
MPVLDPYSFECLSHSEEQTQRLGARLGVLLPAHAIVALIGTLGAGKTQFARGIGAGWGAQQPLRSPSFTLVQEHRRDRERFEEG